MGETLHLLGICASPRKDGNTEYLLDEALRSATAYTGAEVKTDRITFAGKRVSPCLSCYGCIDAKGECVIADDFQVMRDAWLRADAILYAVPVYVMAIPGQLKCFLDRLANSLVFDASSSRKRLTVAGVVAQGMHFAAGQESVIRELANVSMLLGCLPIAGDSYNGVRGWTYEKLSRSAYRKSSEEESTLTLLEEVRGLASDLLTVALVVRSGLRVHREWLAESPTYASALQKLSG